MAPLGVTRKPGANTPDLPPHVKLFNDVRNRLEIEKQVTFEESGKAFVQAQERVAEPDTRQFVNDVMVGAVEIFLNQQASNVQPALLIHFEDVLKSSARIISWELRTLYNITHLELLGKILDAQATFYQDKKALIAGTRRCHVVRDTIARELLQDGTFTLLLQMLRGTVPVKEWSPADYSPPPGKPIPDHAPLNARIINMVLIVPYHARLQEIDLLAFGEACIKEVSTKFVGEILKRQKAEDILEMHAILVQIFGLQDESFHEFSLSLWLRCFETDAFAIKKLGLENLIRVCAEASRHRVSAIRMGLAEPDRTRSTTTSASTSAGVSADSTAMPSTSWDDTKVCAWLIDKKVLDSLFGTGAQTHSALVGRSKSLLEHMAMAGTLGPAQIDMIFESCVGQHESSRGAVHSLLAELLLDLSSSLFRSGSDSTPILILHRATFLTAKRPEEMYYFARKLMQLESTARNRGIMISRNADLQKALLEFLWTLALRTDLSTSDEKEAEQRADQILGDFNDALRTAVVPLPTATQRAGDKMNEDRIFFEFLSRCEAIIQPTSSQDSDGSEVRPDYSDAIVWRACLVLKHLIELHADVAQPPDQIWFSVDRPRPEWTKQTQSAFVEDLDKRLHLSDWLVDRITNSLASLSERKVKARLDFLRFIAERIRTYDCFDFEKVKLCWIALASRPELRLTWFQELVTTTDYGRPRVLPQSVITRVFNELICTSSLASLETEKGFDCFAAYFEEVNKDVIGPLKAMMLNLPPSSSVQAVAGIETLWSVAIQGSGKVAEKAASMLLQVQKRLELQNVDSGIAFVERVMNALRNAEQEDRKNRCLKLASAYFSSQVILDSHASAMGGGMSNAVQEVTVHHDDILTFSVEDIGKVMEKRFKDKDGFSWYPGLLYEFNPQTNEHHVFFRDGDLKKYSMASLVREHSPSLAEMGTVERQQFRMLSVVSDGILKPEAKANVNQKIYDALRRYRGLRIGLAPTTTLSELKSHVMDQLGRRGFEISGMTEEDFEFQVELDAPLAMIPDYLKMRINIPAAAGGKHINYVRYRITNETLPAVLIASRFGARLFLCAITLEPEIPAGTSSVAPVPWSTSQGDQVTPASYASREDSEHIALLMALIQDPSLSGNTKKEAWTLLMNLPTERGLLRRSTSAQFDWVKELDSNARDNTVLIQVYLLQIADKACTETMFDQRRDAVGKYVETDFELAFFRPAVAERVLALFSRVMSKDFNDEFERGVALRVLVRVIRRFVEHKLVPNPKQLSHDLTRLILWDMRNTAPSAPVTASTLAAQGSNQAMVVQTTTLSGPSQYVTANGSAPTSGAATPGLEETGELAGGSGNRLSASSAGVSSDLSLAAVTMEMELVEDDSNHASLLDGDPESGRTLTDVLLEAPQLAIRESTYRLLLRITETNRDLVFASVLRTLNRVPHYMTTCANFFDFVNEFIVMGTPEQITTSCSALMTVVRARLKAYSYSGTGEDPTLNCLIDLCRKLVDHGSGDVQEDDGLIQILLSRYLLAVSTSTMNIATSPATRQRCFVLLRSLVAKNAQSYSSLIGKLDMFVSLVDKPLARGGRSWDFNYRADDTKRPPGTYVGLVNQGATCYQNSVLQQLFMRKEMRKLILNAIPSFAASIAAMSDRGDFEEDAATPTGDGVEPVTKKKIKSKRALLTQLQKLFSFLEGSEQRFFNPRLFVNQSSILRLTDGHMSQNDCIEFYSLLMDYLEDVFKGRPERDQLRNLFVCSMTSLTMRHCPQKHKSEKEESTFYISLSIRFGPEGRALNSLDEALDEWSKSEHLSDLICEECFPPKPELAKQSSGSSQAGGSAAGGGAKAEPQAKQRFDADQVKFITRFPPVLVLQLKRFDFDYDTLLPTKLNHRVSFEQRLDLGRFSREAVLRQFEGGGDNEEKPHVWYRLKGVVVHQGTGANFGHYYSFIEDDEKKAWFRFDDERVTPFDLSNLEEECFGGPVTEPKSNNPAYASAAAAATKRGSYGSGGLRNNNGYLLIYAKEESTGDPLARQPSTAISALSAPPASLTAAPRKSLALRAAAKLVWMSLAWRSRARAYLEAKQMIKEHEAFVAKENERVLRHSIAFAPDFLQFCLRIVLTAPGSPGMTETGLSEAGRFAVNALTRIVLFAFSEKERYEQWAVALRQIFAKSSSAERVICDWLVKKVCSEELWLERLLVQCLDARSSSLFTDLLVHAIPKTDPSAVHQLVDGMIKVFPKNALEAARYTPADGNYFVVLRALALQPGVRQQLLGKDIVLQLIRLLDETAQVQPQQASQPPAPEDRHVRNSDMSGYTTVARDDKLCRKVVAALDALLIESPEDDYAFEVEGVEDELESFGFPPFPVESARALFAESLLNILVQYSPKAGKRLIARLCDCSISRYEKCFERLVNMLNASQSPAKAIEAPYIVPDACEVLEYLFLALDLDPNAKAVREQHINYLVRLVKETKRQASERKEAQASRTAYYTSAYADERQETHRASVLLITYVAELLTSLALKSDACRSVLKQLKWSWMVQAGEINSFESSLGGNESCATRNIERGRAVRRMLRAANALGQLPRPIVPPCLSLSYYVEDAGTSEANGLYRFDGFFPPGASETVDTVTPKFVRVDPTTGKRLTIFRCSASETQLWYISEVSDKPGTTSDIDYYQSKDTGTGLPDGRWTTCGQGTKPAPKHLTPHRAIPNPDDDLLEYFQ